MFYTGHKAESGSNRVIRGGSWNNNANNLQVGNVNSNNPYNENNNIGFRPVSTGALESTVSFTEGSAETARVQALCPALFFEPDTITAERPVGFAEGLFAAGIYNGGSKQKRWATASRNASLKSHSEARKAEESTNDDRRACVGLTGSRQ